MHPISRRNLIVSSALAGVVSFTGCTNQKPTNGTEVTIGLSYIPNVQFAPFYVAVEKGLFADLGLNIKLRHHGAQEDLFGALVNGTEQVLCASSDEAAVFSSQGNVTVQTFATMYQHYPVCLITKADSGLKTLTDLAGKRIGLPGRYCSSYYGLLAGLTNAELAESDVQLVEIGYTGVAALIADKVDAIVGFRNNEPLQFAAQNVAVNIIEVVDQNNPTLVGPGLLVKKDSQQKPILEKISKALLQAEEFIVENIDQTLEIAAKYIPDLDQDTAKKNANQVLVETTKLWLVDSKPTMKVDLSQFERMVELMVGAGVIANQIDPKTLVIS